MTDQPGHTSRPGGEQDQDSGTAPGPRTATDPETGSERDPGARPESAPGFGPSLPHPRPEQRPSGPAGTGPGGREPGSGGPAGLGDLAGRNALWMAVAGLALTLLGNVWGALAGLVLCTIALVTGIKARRRARLSRTTAPGAEVGIAVGAAGLVFSLFITGMSALLYQEMTAYGRCINVSNTHSDKEQCQQQFLRSIERRFGRPAGELEKNPLFG